MAEEIIQMRDPQDTGKVLYPVTLGEAVKTKDGGTLEDKLDSHVEEQGNPHGTSKFDIGLGNVTNDAQVKRSEIGVAGGVASLDTSGKIPGSQLPSYVDDVLEYSGKASFPGTGETGKIYVDLGTNLCYRWTGSTYIEISQSLALGETSETAYRGDRGKTAYDHVSSTSNPHGVTKSQVGLGNVVNTGDSATPLENGTTKFTTGGAYTELGKKENTSNKVTTVTSSSDDTHYPSAKAVWTSVKDKVDFTKVTSLTEEYQAQKLVKYSEQALSDDEKKQALTNLGIPDVEANSETAKATAAQALATVSQVSTYAKNMTDASRTEALALATDVAALKSAVWSGTMTEFLALGSYSTGTTYQITED